MLYIDNLILAMNKAQIKVYTKVIRFLKKIEIKQPMDYDSITSDMDIVMKVGIEKSLEAEHITKIKGHKEPIYELKSFGIERSYRLMGTIIGNVMHIVHAFVKKVQKTRDSDIAITKKRLKNEDLI